MLEITFVQFELQKSFLALISWCCCLSEQWGPQSTVWNSPCLGRNLRSKEPSSLWRFASLWKGTPVSLQFIAIPPASSRGWGRVGREKMTSIFYCRSTSFRIWFILKGCRLIFLALIFLLFVWIYFVIFHLLAWWTSARRMQLWWQHTDRESERFAQCLSHPNGSGGLGIKGKLF